MPRWTITITVDDAEQDIVPHRMPQRCVDMITLMYEELIDDGVMDVELVSTEKSVIPKPRQVQEMDNRDDSTTWLHFDDGTYVEVNPRDLMGNVIENLPEPLNTIYEAFFLEFLTKLDTDLQKEIDGQ